MAVRLGGEEFMLVCRESDIEQGPRIAERLRQSIASHCFSTQQADIQLTCSIGYLSCELVDPELLEDNLERIMKLADMALYAAKHSGRDGWIGLDCSVTDSPCFPDSLPHLKEKLAGQQIRVCSSTEQITWC